VTRIQPLPFDEWDLDAISVVAPGRQIGPSNVLGLFANHPALAKAFLGYNAYLLGRDSTIPPHTRELVILRVSWRRRCRYEWAQHVQIARRAGVTDAEIAMVRAGAGDDAGAGPGAGAGAAPGHEITALIITAVDELDANSGLSDATYQALADKFDDRQLMDLVFTIGTYGLLAMAFNAFGLDLDPGLSDEGFDSTNE
jgi:AhpD family alkylhydroperoxidase